MSCNCSACAMHLQQLPPALLLRKIWSMLQIHLGAAASTNSKRKQCPAIITTGEEMPGETTLAHALTICERGRKCKQRISVILKIIQMQAAWHADDLRLQCHSGKCVWSIMTCTAEESGYGRTIKMAHTYTPHGIQQEPIRIRRYTYQAYGCPAGRELAEAAPMVLKPMALQIVELVLKLTGKTDEKDEKAHGHGPRLAVQVLEARPHILQGCTLCCLYGVHARKGSAVLQQLVQDHGKGVDIDLDVVGLMPEHLQDD